MSFEISYPWAHPQIGGGAPMVRGSRVTLEAIHERVTAGDTLEATLEDLGVDAETGKLAYAEWINNAGK